jgi:hypothetical protein
MKRLPEKPSTIKETNNKGEIFSNIVKLVQALAWPALAFFLFIFYRDPFSRSIEQIPDLIGHASEMKLGSVSFKIEQKAQASSDTKLADALRGLSPDARRILLERGDSYMNIWTPVDVDGVTVYSRPKISAAFQELLDRKLVEFTGPRNSNGMEPVSSTRKDPRDLGLVLAQGAITWAGDVVHEDFKPSRALTQADLDWLKHESYRLTELGKKAFDVIVDVVTHT